MDRKALIRQYKETRRPMGVYRVHNTRDDRSFVGVSRDLPSILNRNRLQLETGGHQNRSLQHDWTTLGAEAFAFEILDELSVPEQPDYDPTDDLRVLESLWLDRLQPYDARGYNTRPKSAG
ncbi:MAG TPA: GIY-YIG nuclease family protein [Candidatus Binatia bacterium]|jgi:hypothetical protein|nr:GIY-YIG nuclease family protein [Candidatus Binatia bacterium]